VGGLQLRILLYPVAIYYPPPESSDDRRHSVAPACSLARSMRPLAPTYTNVGICIIGWASHCIPSRLIAQSSDLQWAIQFSASLVFCGKWEVGQWGVRMEIAERRTTPQACILSHDAEEGRGVR